jgi:hypothetical protein
VQDDEDHCVGTPLDYAAMNMKENCEIHLEMCRFLIRKGACLTDPVTPSNSFSDEGAGQVSSEVMKELAKYSLHIAGPTFNTDKDPRKPKTLNTKP